MGSKVPGFGWGVAAVALMGCPSPTECPDGQTLDADGVCVADDTDLVDTDPADTDVEAEFSRLTVEWTVVGVPNDNVLTVTCDGRERLSQSNFPSARTYSAEVEVQEGEVCEVRIDDARGGLLASGRVLNCSTEVATWEGERSTGKVVASVTAFGCVPGCPDPVALNYQAWTNYDDGSCEYILGCTDARAVNFNAAATKDDGTCNYGGDGLIEATVTLDDHPEDTIVRLICNGVSKFEKDGGTAYQLLEIREIVQGGFSCVLEIEDQAGDQGPGGQVTVCGQPIAAWERTEGVYFPGQSIGGYTETVAEFFVPACAGCTDPAAPNFDPDAYVENGTCEVPPI